MAIQPATYNFTLQRRSDHAIPLLFKDSSNNAINLTGFTVAAQVWEETRTTKYADFSVAYTDRAAGSVSISLTDTQTATFTPNVLKYDVLLTNASGDKEYYLEGTIFVSEGYTA
jgi:hypothetical protein|tara:strand:+ start:2138 stop:2479 length:342 start_codon:yes stop_codon:yes gene_type:complete